eukprot:TRINITY_DN6901_c1_g2_i1.p1 TRINITY_DN6901_c1_g2~~TRINITY_DN6901_c1_g2_i1.p1  ORF type:complete len:178 (-),score=7.81 TRINITY_DN6901_c1_g2_i1:23-556(-)
MTAQPPGCFPVSEGARKAPRYFREVTKVELTINSSVLVTYTLHTATGHVDKTPLKDAYRMVLSLGTDPLAPPHPPPQLRRGTFMLHLHYYGGTVDTYLYELTDSDFYPQPFDHDKPFDVMMKKISEARQHAPTKLWVSFCGDNCLLLADKLTVIYSPPGSSPTQSTQSPDGSDGGVA